MVLSPAPQPLVQAPTTALPQPLAIPWYVQRRPPIIRGRAYEVTKRSLDLLASVVLLPLVLSVLAILALLIRLDSPGPPFFSQVRTGRGGRRFRMYKLRTMVQNAEELKQSLMHLNELAPPDFKISDDPRMTRVGRFLRKTSLDELPQLLNVLRGDMTLVGPRPTSFSPERYRLWHTARLDIKPGLTGLWQISGRSELEFDERVRLDVSYTRNRCMWLDLQILARTVLCVFDGRGAS